MPRRRLAAATGLVVVASLVVAAPASARNRTPKCVEGIQWTKDHAGLDVAYSRVITNRGKTATTTHVSVSKSKTVSKKITAGVEASVGGGFGPFSASVKAQLGYEVAASVTTARDVTEDVVTKPGYQTVYSYGAETRVLGGIILEPFVGPGAPPSNSGIPGCTLRKTKTFKAVLPTGAEKSRVTNRRLRRSS